MRIFLVLLFSAMACAQSHEILRPTVDNTNMTTCVSDINVPSVAMPNSWDSAGLSTFSVLNLTNTDPFNQKVTIRDFNTWMATTNTYTALTLNVNSSGSHSAGPGGQGTIAYSINGGGTYTNIRQSTSGWSQVTDSVVLSAGQDLTQVRVTACSLANTNDGSRNGSWLINIWDIWTDGTYTPTTPTPTPTPIAPPAPAVPQPVVISQKNTVPIWVIWFCGRLW